MMKTACVQKYEQHYVTYARSRLKAELKRFASPKS